MSRVIRKVVSRTPVVKQVAEALTGGGGQQVQEEVAKVTPTKPKAPATKPKQVVNPKPATGAVSGQMQTAESRYNRRRGRRSGIMTGSRGVTGNVQVAKKTLLGG